MNVDEYEIVATFFLHENEIFNIIRGFGELVEELEIVYKVLRYLPSRFNLEVSTIEEMIDFQKLSMDALHGILTAYEMRIEKEKSDSMELAFKAAKETTNHKSHEVSNYESNEEEAQFVREMKNMDGKIQRKASIQML